MKLKKLRKINARILIIGSISAILLMNVIGAASGEIIRVATNRYSVFAPYDTANQINYDADNSSFTFASGALLVGANGLPLANTDLNYYIYSGDGTLKKSGVITTNGNGIAIVTYNTFKDFTSNTDTDYGNWTIKVALTANTSIYDNATVNIDISGGGCSRALCHNNPGDTTSTTSSPRSPYSDNFGITSTSSMVYGAHVIKGGTHGVADSDSCVNCHVGLDRAPLSITTNAPWGVHRNIDCLTCHPNPETWPITIPDCFSSGCHPLNNNNLTNTSTLATISGISNVSIYSTTNNTTVVPNSVHKGSQYSGTTGVPCWICHGPMHNITKPDPLPANTNNITEYTQCTACHNALYPHNNSISCTLCHSQDVHNIKVFALNATYVTGKTNSARGNCTNCHQNSTFISALKSQPKAGNYSGRDPPSIQNPVKHSDDLIAGKKWNQTPGYWSNTSQVTWCLYCHGNASHYAAALGVPSGFKGNNIVNSTISTSTTWCVSCHMQGYSSGSSNYNSMVASFAGSQVPPEITGDAIYGANKSNPAYFNHSTVNNNDATCSGCHRTTSTTMTGFMHNVTTGVYCKDCHYNWSVINDIYESPEKYVNETLVNQSVHVNVSCMDCHVYIAGHPYNGTYPRYGWKWCEDCHSNTQDPQNDRGRHLIVSNPWNNFFNGMSVMNITTCPTCHNAVLYNNSKNTYGKETGIDCDYCHSFPDDLR